jgi:hypothetical protein
MQPQNIFAQRMGMNQPMGANPPHAIAPGLGQNPAPTAPIMPYHPMPAQPPQQMPSYQMGAGQAPQGFQQPVGAMPYQPIQQGPMPPIQQPLEGMMQNPDVMNYLRRRMGM